MRRLKILHLTVTFDFDRPEDQRQTGSCLFQSFILSASTYAFYSEYRMVFLDEGRKECLRKMKYGAMMGGGVGAAAGLIFGGYEATRYRGIPVSQVCCTSLSTCSLISSFGEVIHLMHLR